MKKILMLLVCCLTMATMIQAQQPKEYPLFADGVVEFGYLVNEDVYYIVYRDTTTFPDFQLFEDEGWWEETYISIECTKEDFFKYLFWFSEEKEKKSKAFYDADDRYIIKEIATEVEGGTNYRFYLEKIK